MAAAANLVAAWREDAVLGGRTPQKPSGALTAQTAPAPEAMVQRLAGARSAYASGRGATFAVAAEAALKLKETCAISGLGVFRRRGAAIGLVETRDAGSPVVAFLPQDEAREGMNDTLCRPRPMGADVFIVDASGTDDDPGLVAAAAAHPI